MAARDLALRRYRRFATTTGLTEGVLAIALPLTAIELAEQPLQIAVVVALLYTPWALRGLAGSHPAATLDRRTALGAAATMRSLAALVVTIELARGQAGIGLIQLAALVAGVADALGDEADGLATDFLVGTDASTTDGWITRLGVIGLVVGIALGAVLWDVLDALPFVFVTMLSSTGALFALLLPEPLLPGPSIAGTGPNAGPTRRAAMPLTAAMALLAAASGATMGTLVLISHDGLELGAIGYAAFLVALVIAGVVGAGLSPVFGGALGLRGGLLAGAVVTAAGSLAAGATVDPERPLVAVGALLAAAAGSALTIVSSRALLSDLAGAMQSGNSVRHRFHTAIWFAAPLGALLAGILADGALTRPLTAAGLLAATAAVVSMALPPPVATAPAEIG